jgi:hypothetical protein
MNVQRMRGLREQQRKAEIDEQLQPLRSRLLEAQVATAEQSVQQPAELGNERNLARLKSLSDFSQTALPRLLAGDTSGVQSLLLQRRQSLLSAAASGQQVDTTETDEALQLLQTNPELLAQRMQQAIDAQSQIAATGQGATAGEREFQTLTALVKADPELKTPEAQAAAVKLGLRPRAGLSAAERIATDPRLSEKVAAAEAEKEGAKEGAKLGQQLKFKPLIQSAIKLAEEEARAQGESLTTLKRARAALPGLLETVGALRQLAPVATSTFGGKAFNTVVKELGFGATKGATARAKFVALIDNQILPLLRETFGAAFTQKEGETLKATMGDPDASPEEKIAQLDAFIEQKMRSIETSERETAPTGSSGGTVLRFDAQGNLIQ